MALIIREAPRRCLGISSFAIHAGGVLIDLPVEALQSHPLLCPASMFAPAM